jgi:hypothetical protein
MDAQQRSPATGMLPGLGAAPPPAAAAAQPAAAAQADDEDEDDLMITLDENATSVEPSASRYQYTRQPAAAPAGGPSAVGAAPGQHADAAEGAAPPGLGGPRGYGGHSAIGGIPRSAIPGLGGAAGGYQSPAIPGLGGAPPAPGGAPSQPAAAAAALAAPSMRGGMRPAHQQRPGAQQWRRALAAIMCQFEPLHA